MDLSRIEHITCYEGQGSLVDITVTGGNFPYAYFWSDGTNQEDLVNKPAGDYQVTISDVNGCRTTSDIFTIEQPTEIDIAASSIVNVLCSGSDNGFLSVDVSGGTRPYQYNWSSLDGLSGQENTLSSLLPGQYSVTVVDALDCKSAAISFEIENLDVPVNVELSILDNVDCFGDSTGMVAAVVQNGSLPLDFNWSSGEKSITGSMQDTIGGLISDYYRVTVTDKEGCVGVSDSIYVSSSSELSANLTMQRDNNCWFGMTGIIEIELEGGLGPYNVIWDEGSMGTRLIDLEP